MRKALLLLSLILCGSLSAQTNPEIRALLTSLKQVKQECETRRAEFEAQKKKIDEYTRICNNEAVQALANKNELEQEKCKLQNNSTALQWQINDLTSTIDRINAGIQTLENNLEISASELQQKIEDMREQIIQQRITQAKQDEACQQENQRWHQEYNKRCRRNLFIGKSIIGAFLTVYCYAAYRALQPVVGKALAKII